MFFKGVKLQILINNNFKKNIPKNLCILITDDFKRRNTPKELM